MVDYSLLAFVTSIIGVSLRALAIARIKYRHPSEWLRLNKPTYLDQGPSDIGANSVNEFLFRGKFFSAKDNVLNIICILMFVVAAFCIAFMVLAIIYEA